MNYQTANLILDRVVDGESYPLNIVNKALEMTGDLNGLRATAKRRGKRAKAKRWTGGLKP